MILLSPSDFVYYPFVTSLIPCNFNIFKFQTSEHLAENCNRDWRDRASAYVQSGTIITVVQVLSFYTTPGGPALQIRVHLFFSVAVKPGVA